ncbi:MAG: pentapeptide repeat-containing protein [Crocosphaera sp.]
MFKTQEAIDLIERYQNGQRNFQDFQLRRADLRGINLCNTDFTGVDLSYANLRDVDFSGVDLRDAYLNEADLTGANLTGANLGDASLIKIYLIKANCYQTNFSGAYLNGAYLTKSTFKEAQFNGAYLNGAKLSGAKLIGAYYNKKTKFDSIFNPQKAQMIRIESEKKMIEQPREMTGIQTTQNNPDITIEQFISIFNHLTEISRRYLGKTMTHKYWESSRPLFEWLDNFAITSSTEIIFKGEEELQTILTSTKFKWCQSWVITFIKNCSQIVQNYPQMLDSELVNSLISQSNTQDNTKDSLNHLTSVKSEQLELLSV